MISDKNILTFLYILLFIFFLFVHLTANFKKKFLHIPTVQHSTRKNYVKRILRFF